ncbi:MAG TPA: T9SS type A sorting domain-containing protein [Candidatus Krumholzibacteria bacterium]|nr:T9SS type A sorting domain-containing protein [Candidatus Krumholzibacteria bacterium]
MRSAILIGSLALHLGVGVAEARKPAEAVPTSEAATRARPTDGSLTPDPRFAITAANTTVLASYNFDIGASCNENSWTKVDATAQIAVYWHVDDFAGANVKPGDAYAALSGAKSLWCGTRHTASGPTCGYLALPGYGNRWNQSWRTKDCIAVTGDLDVSFLMQTDSEAAYDATVLEYTTDCSGPFTGWTELDGGIGVWDGIQGPFAHSASYPVAGSPVKVRLRFESDGAWSDEDANYDSHSGPIVIDNLVAEGLALEDFEDEAQNATTSNDWEGFAEAGYGQFLALFSGAVLLQQDACAKNLSCQWAAIQGSSETYACGGFPLQAAVPKGNSDGQYLQNEVWSPSFALAGTGSVVDLKFTVYRDMTLDALVFYTWGVRTVSPIGCQSAWRSRGYVYFGDQKDYLVNTFPVGDLVPGSAVSMRVRLGVVDQCGVWCGIFGTGACHSHAPLLDKVRVYRVDVSGPVWSTRDIDMFQDTFPADGTDTGIGRADAALSITPAISPTILPGDSACFVVSDPITAVPVSNPSGLADDLALGGKQCYLWVHVIDFGVPAPPGKSGSVLSGGPPFPFKDTQTADGKTWTRIQCRLRVESTNTFDVDLNDNLFEAGDVIEFFFGATNTNGETSYCSGSALDYVQSDVDLAAESASEFTILPLYGNGFDSLLYVDGLDGRGGQIFWDTAFDSWGLSVDRYDVRGPTSSVSNRPAARVTDVAAQLNDNYDAILWDAGDLTQSLGDGTGSPEKSNDYALVNSFLAGLTARGGVYICGDDFPSGLNAASGASAVVFKSTYITFTLTTGNHKPSFGTSPIGTPVPGGAFDHTFVIFGGCPLINDFDVMAPTGASIAQISYGAPAANNAAVVSKAIGSDIRTMISGFSLVYIRDDEEDGILDRLQHLWDILTYLGIVLIEIDAPPLPFVDRLEQNYPNPFNPQTTIGFSIKESARVRIDVFDVSGARVRSLLDETRAAGSYSDVRWDGTNDTKQPVASGVYFYRLVAGGFRETRKMVLLK